MEHLGETLVQALLPARCLLCNCSLPWRSSGGVCAGCWAQLPRLEAPRCPTCGEPSAQSPCLACAKDPPPWQRLVAVFLYESQAKQLVPAFKNGHDTLAKPLAQRLLTQLQQNQFPGFFTVTFVPMRRWRLVRRGYNQAELLARELAKQAQWDFQPLLRRIAGGSQKGLSRSARKAQMVSSFLSARTVPPRVLLVDDVVTTGATAAACCKALRKGGAREIWVAAVAKTPRRR